jgi:hypothetical protein
MVARYANRIKQAITSSGSTDLVLGSAASGYRTFALAGINSGDVVRYIAEEGSNWEIGWGIYSNSPMLTRNVLESNSGTIPVNLTGAGYVSMAPVAQDLPMNLFNPPNMSSMTVVATLETHSNHLLHGAIVELTPQAADIQRMFYTGISSGSSFKVTANIIVPMKRPNLLYGLALKSNSDSFIFFGPDLGPTQENICIHRYDSVLSFGSVVQTGLWKHPPESIWLQVEETSSTRFYRASMDGVFWTDVYSSAQNSTLTTVGVGFSVNALVSSNPLPGSIKYRIPYFLVHS